MEPDHTVGLNLFALELRLDYMGTGVLMCRVSSLVVSLRDEWKMTTRKTSIDAFNPFPDGSSGAGSAWAPQDACHHRHWQRVLAQVAGLHLSTVRQPLPPSGTVLGGTMELHGHNISLACFHGINFKSKSWALFSLKEPCISFATEAQEVHTNETSESLDVHIVQTLTFSLGLSGEQPHAPEHHSMATVCKVSRNVLFPPQFRTLQEWFHYAFSCSDMDEVDRFPSVERERLDSSDGGPVRSRTPKQDPNHTREVIFALPSLQLHLKTEHWQATLTPEPTDEKPIVECSFVTEFEDHIFVTVDAEAFFFLHDLITSYIREKDRVQMGYPGIARAQSPELAEKHASRRGESGKEGEVLSGGAAGDGLSHPSPSTSDDKKQKTFEHAEVTGYTKDWRNYHCKTWHLEPTVRLLSWGGKSIEPYGVDYILQKLGFSHARTTIPKWMQRGFMDPLDTVLAVLVLRMVQIVREDPKIAEHMRHRR